MGFSFKRMFRHPFGKHSLFHKATQVASILPIPGSGLFSAAARLAARGQRFTNQLKGTFGGVRQLFLPPSQQPAVAMPGGTRVAHAPRPTSKRRRRAKRVRMNAAERAWVRKHPRDRGS